MKRTVVRRTSNLFHLSGINLDAQKYEAKGYMRIFVFTTLISCTLVSLGVYGIAHSNNVEEGIKTLVYINSTVVVFLMYIKFLQLRSRLRLLLRKIDDNVFTYSDEDQIEVTYEWLLDERNTRTVYRCILVYQVFGFALAGVAPFIGFMRGKTVTFLVYPGWTPWTTNSALKFVLTYVYQSLTATSVFWMLYVSQTFVVFVVLEFLRQNRRLQKALSTIEGRTTKEVSHRPQVVRQNTSHEYNRIFARNLVECVRHHQELVKLFETFGQWFSVIYAAELALDIMTLAFTFYLLLNLKKSSEAYLSIFGATFVVITCLFSRCIVGEIFADMNEKLAQIIFYDITWSLLNAQNRILVLLFHGQVRRPFRLNAFSIYTASYAIFTKIIRISYSSVNILRVSLRTQ